MIGKCIYGIYEQGSIKPVAFAANMKAAKRLETIFTVSNNKDYRIGAESLYTEGILDTVMRAGLSRVVLYYTRGGGVSHSVAPLTMLATELTTSKYYANMVINEMEHGFQVICNQVPTREPEEALERTTLLWKAHPQHDVYVDMFDDWKTAEESTNSHIDFRQYTVAYHDLQKELSKMSEESRLALPERVQ